MFLWLQRVQYVSGIMHNKKGIGLLEELMLLTYTLYKNRASLSLT